MKKNPLSLLCLTLSVAILLTLSLHPKTGWLVRQQTQAAFGGKGPALVKALDCPTALPKLSQAGELARTLRELCREKLTLERKVEEQFYDPRYKALTRKQPRKALSLYEIEALTTQGAQCDPENAFFPTLHAVALLAVHSDKQALAELHRAAQLPRWDDYTQAELVAWLELQNQVPGGHSALGEMFVEQHVSLAHLSRLRALGRTVTALAAKRELAGGLDVGLAIRHDLRALGERLREQGGTQEGQQVGSALTYIAMGRPGGEAPKTYTGSSAEIQAARRQDMLRAHEHYWGKAEAVALEGLFARNDAAKVQRDQQVDPGNSFYLLVLQWQLSLSLLAAPMATLLVGAFCSALAKLIGPKPVCGGVSLGVALAALGACVLFGAVEPLPTRGFLALVWGTSLAGVFLLYLFLRETPSCERLREGGRALLTLAAAGQVVLLGVLATWGVFGTFRAFSKAYLCGWSDSDTVMLHLSYAVPVLLPLVLLIPFLMLYRSAPLVFCVLRRLGKCTLPLVLALTLAYAWQVEQTAHLEARLKAELRAFYSGT